MEIENKKSNQKVLFQEGKQVYLYGIIFPLLFFFTGQIISSVVTFPFIDGANMLDNSPNEIKIALFISQIGSFILPAVLFLIIFYKKNWRTAFFLGKWSYYTPLLSILAVFFLLPTIQLSFLLNSSIPFPEWIIEMEKSSELLIFKVLSENTGFSLFLNVLLIGLLPGIGEELFFRGIMQGGMQKRGLNHHTAIWLTAFIFSAMHFQFLGFAPRMLLGAALGYIYVYSNSLIIPMICHSLYNGLQVVVASVIGVKGLENINEINLTPTFYFIVISTGAFSIFILTFLKKLSKNDRLTNQMVENL